MLFLLHILWHIILWSSCFAQCTVFRCIFNIYLSLWIQSTERTLFWNPAVAYSHFQTQGTCILTLFTVYVHCKLYSVQCTCTLYEPVMCLKPAVNILLYLLPSNSFLNWGEELKTTACFIFLFCYSVYMYPKQR